MKTAVKNLLDRDVEKRDGDVTVSPLSRMNALALVKSAWWRLTNELRYHPYKMVHTTGS